MIAAVLILLAAHGLPFYFLRHLALSAVVVSGIVALVVVKHIGVFPDCGHQVDRIQPAVRLLACPVPKAIPTSGFHCRIAERRTGL
jgi:hypothetical protein